MWQRIKNIYHLLVAFFFNCIFLFPGKSINVIGVTGTDGKTTTANLIYHILKTAGKNVSLISSVGAIVNNKGYDLENHVTTPSSFILQKFLRRAVSQKSEYFVIEVTSHSIDQHRIWGIPFKIGVLTNITPEHLDYHKTFDAYVSTKIKLLNLSQKVIANIDDSSYAFLGDVKNKKNIKNWITYGFHKSAEINIDDYNYESKYLVGDFNKYNMLAGIASAKALGLTDEEIKKGVAGFKPPIGRFDIVYSGSFSVMIDFAHTPNAFANLLSSLKPIVKGRIIHVFGSAGERDAHKRPFMGEISSKYSEIIVLTSEDPRSEDPNKIAEEIVSGIKNNKCQVFKIIERQKAVEAAIQMAKDGDMVLITGKAHEKSMNYGKGEEPWDEYNAVESALKKRK
ncbi:MAG: UDP-N-acetylmuramoyl-L-alanyl-D-glutamate--2,6-diaminopimelate ligase [Candidatus Levybacteria bacterium]|nr:UDP-N-acetylmuramoyl-L-alanyl-D-glutamate--2,6-diaminopimelate ligase [Candidatus Levybacteria bacterium]MBI2420480.1 UDP-N-acetylmuramoyl-L-alanyl-D-glutamate--2,6-diaminopimelate ligase [Candidatus Levybacteria bacterium]